MKTEFHQMIIQNDNSQMILSTVEGYKPTYNDIISLITMKNFEMAEYCLSVSDLTNNRNVKARLVDFLPYVKNNDNDFYSLISISIGLMNKYSNEYKNMRYNEFFDYKQIIKFFDEFFFVKNDYRIVIDTERRLFDVIYFRDYDDMRFYVDKFKKMNPLNRVLINELFLHGHQYYEVKFFEIIQL